MMTALNLAAWFACLCLMLAMGCALLRMLRGPAAQDRVWALDGLFINVMLTLIVLGVRSRSAVYFDVALLIALFGFVGTIALAKFLLRGEVIEP